MNFYRAVFHEKNFLENIHKKLTYHLIFTLSDQNYAQTNYDLKSRLCMPQNCGVSKKSKTF